MAHTREHRYFLIFYLSLHSQFHSVNQKKSLFILPLGLTASRNSLGKKILTETRKEECSGRVQSLPYYRYQNKMV